MINCQTFTTKDVCLAADIKPETLRVWRSRGIYNLGIGVGHKRFNFIEVCQTALMVSIQKAGLSFEEAFNLATTEELADILKPLYQQKLQNNKSSANEEKTFIGICRYFSDQFYEEIDTKIMHSKDLQSIDNLFLPVASAFGDKKLQVTSICLIPIEHITIFCFDALKDKIINTNEGMEQ